MRWLRARLIVENTFPAFPAKLTRQADKFDRMFDKALDRQADLDLRYPEPMVSPGEILYEDGPVNPETASFR